MTKQKGVDKSQTLPCNTDDVSCNCISVLFLINNLQHIEKENKKYSNIDN